MSIKNKVVARNQTVREMRCFTRASKPPVTEIQVCQPNVVPTSTLVVLVSVHNGLKPDPDLFVSVEAWRDVDLDPVLLVLGSTETNLSRCDQSAALPTDAIFASRPVALVAERSKVANEESSIVDPDVDAVRPVGPGQIPAVNLVEVHHEPHLVHVCRDVGVVLVGDGIAVCITSQESSESAATIASRIPPPVGTSRKCLGAEVPRPGARQGVRCWASGRGTGADDMGHPFDVIETGRFVVLVGGGDPSIELELDLFIAKE